MKNKGFTLIELLSVIIILAVIALIAAPIVLNVVDSAKVEANRDSVYGLLDGAKLYYLEGQLDINRLGIDGETNLIDKINVTGKRPSGGNVYIDDTGLIALSVVYDKVCYKKGFNENEITETNELEECETKINDKTTPEITTVVTSKTDRIKVSLTCNDFESGIIKYEYKIDDKEWIESNNEYIFENLEKEREYEIKTRCTNGVNLVSEESKKISTKGIINPEIAQISQEPSSGTYATKRIIRITYDNTNIENAKNYYSYDAKTWIEVNDTKIELEFTDNGYLYAKTTDGINISTYATYTIANIDTTVPNIKIDISNVKTDRVTLTLTCSDPESGIIKYEYSKDNGTTWVTGSNSSYTFTGLTQETSYKYVGRCTNGSGLTNTSSSTNTTNTITNPVIVQASQEPSSGTYATKRIIRITYDNTNIENAKNYYSYDAKTWIEVNDTKIELEFTDNGYLYAKTTDGINTSVYATYTIANIDTTKPEISIILSGTLGSNNWYISDVVGKITLTNIVPSGVTYYYGTNNPTNVGSQFTESNGGVTTYYVKACSNTGICSDIITSDVKIDKTQINLNLYDTYVNVLETQLLTVTLSNELGSDVTWSSNNQSVVSVNNGVITGISPGNAIVTVQSNYGSKKSTSINVKVVNKGSNLVENSSFEDEISNINFNSPAISTSSRKTLDDLVSSGTLGTSSSSIFSKVDGNYVYFIDSENGDAYTGLYSHKTVIKPGKTYTISVDYLYATTSNINHSSWFDIVDKNLQHISYIALNTGEDNQWTFKNVSSTFTAPENAAYIIPRFGFYSETYSWMMFDSLKIVEN